MTEQELLPISADILETDEEERRDDAMRGDFIFEPEPEEILARLLPVYLETQVYRALLESAASEQGARMTAMRNASKNAGELIDTPDAADEPGAPGGDHAGDARGGRGRRSDWPRVCNPRLTAVCDGPTRIRAMDRPGWPASTQFEEGQERFAPAIEVATRLLDNIETVVYGKREEVKLVLAALMCGGHVLLEDVPGTAKTVLARAIAGSIDGVTISRIQCTPGPPADGRHRACRSSTRRRATSSSARARSSRTSSSSTRSTARRRRRSRRCSRRWPRGR